jgi:hypothetical protein
VYTVAKTERGNITSEKLSEFTNFGHYGKHGNYNGSDEMYQINIDYIH